MLKGFFDSILDFLGLRQKPRKAEPKLKEAVGKRIMLPPIPTITPKGQARVFVKKEFAKTKLFVKKPFALQKPWEKGLARKPLVARKLIVKKQPSARALQFEIEQILKEAQALKRKLEQKKLKIKGKRKVRKVRRKQKPAFAKKKKFQPLTAEEVQKLRERLQQKQQLSDFELERLKWHLDKSPFEREAEEKELHTLELEKIRKGLSAPQQTQQASVQGTVVQVPQGTQVFIGKQAERPEAVEAVQTVEEQIETTGQLLKSLEQDFLKRRISEQEYRQRVLDLNQKLRELRIRKKIQDEKAGKPQEVAQVRGQQVQQPMAQQKPIPQTMQKQALPQALKQQSQAIRPSTQQPSVQQAPVSREMQRFLEERVGKSDEGKLVQVEMNVQKLMKRFNLSENEAQQEILKIDKAKLLENFDKLVDLIELEQKTQRLMQENLELEKEKKMRALEKPEFGTGFEAGLPEKKKEEVKAIVLEIQKQRIITDFDKLLEVVQRKGKVSASEALKELKISKDRLSDCLKVLEQNNLVRVDFPPIGSEIIYDINYAPPQKKENNLKKK